MNLIDKLNLIGEELEKKEQFALANECVAIANKIDRLDTNINKLYSITWEMQSINRSIAMDLYYLINDIVSDLEE